MKKIGLYLLFIMGLVSLTCSVAAYDFNSITSDSTNVEDDGYGVDVDDYIAEDGEVDVNGIQQAYKDAEDAMLASEDGRDNPFKMDGDTTSYVNATGSLAAGGYKSKLSSYVSSTYGTTASNIWSYSPIGSMAGTAVTGTTTNDNNNKQEYGAVTMSGSGTTSFTGTTGSAAVTLGGASGTGSSFSGTTSTSPTTGRTYMAGTTGSSYSSASTRVYVSGSSGSSYDPSSTYTTYVASLTGTVSSSGTGTSYTRYTGASNSTGGLWGVCFRSSSAASSAASAIQSAVNSSSSNYFYGYSSYSSSGTDSATKLHYISSSTSRSASWGYHTSETAYTSHVVNYNREEMTMYVSSITGTLSSGSSSTVYSGYTTDGGATSNDATRGVWFTTSALASAAATAIKNAVNASTSNYYTGYTSMTSSTTASIYTVSSVTTANRNNNYATSSYLFSGGHTVSGGGVGTTTTKATTTMYAAQVTGLLSSGTSDILYSGSYTDNGSSSDTTRGIWFTTSSAASNAASAISTAVNRHPDNYYTGYTSKTTTSTATIYSVTATTSSSSSINYASSSVRFTNYAVSGGKTTTTQTMYTATLTSGNTTANATTSGSVTVYSGYVNDTGTYTNDALSGVWFNSSSAANTASTAIKNAVNSSPQNYYSGYTSMTSSTKNNVYYAGGSGNASRANNYATTANYFTSSSTSGPGTYKYSTYRTTTYTQSALATTNLTSYTNARDYSFGGSGENQHSAVINSAGAVYTAGYNSNGQLGAGNTTNSTSTTPTGYVLRTLPGSVKGVRVETGATSTVILGEDGNLYGTGTNFGLSGTTSTFTKLTVTGASANAEIVDFKVGSNALFVLYSDGTIFKGVTSFTKISGSIEFNMIDVETTSSTLFAVSSDNVVYTGTGTSLTASSVTPASDIIQVRGGNSQWGYLTDDNKLYRATSLTGTPALVTSDVVYFDMGATSYAYLKKDGTVGGSGITGTITNPDDFNEDYHTNGGLTRNTPPTITKKSQTNPTGTTITHVYGQTIELTYAEYLTFDYTWYVNEKFDANKTQQIVNKITGGTTFTASNWISDSSSPAPLPNVFPMEAGTYTYSAQLQEKKNNLWEDIGNAYEVTFVIGKATADFTLNNTTLAALVGQYAVENNGRDTYNLIMNAITADNYTSYITTMPTVYTVQNSAYVSKNVTDFETHWDVYIEKNGVEVTNNTAMGTSGSFNLVFKFNALEETNYTADTIQKYAFNIEGKTFDLDDSNIELNENKELYSQQNSENTDGSVIEFAYTHYININNTMYKASAEHTVGATITKIVITGDNGFSYTITDYDNANLDTVWAYLPKAVGTYTAVASFTVNGHVFEDTITLIYRITKATPILTVTDNLIDCLESTVLNSGVNSVPNMKTAVMDGIKASGSNSLNPFIEFTPTINTLIGTTLTEVNFANEIYWEVSFTKTNEAGAQQVTNITNEPGTYYVWVSFDISKVDPTFTNYNIPNKEIIAFTLAARGNELETTDFGIVEQTVTGHYVQNVTYLDEIEYGNHYLFNISNEMYNTNTDTVSVVVKLKGSNTVLTNIAYNTMNSNSEAKLNLPKAVGTYVIYVSVFNSDGHEYGTVEKEYSITKATPTVTINAAMDTYLENILINNNGDIENYSLLTQVNNELVAGIDEDGFTSVSQLYSTSGGDLTPITNISKNSWTIYFTHGEIASGDRLNELLPNTTYYVWIVFDSNDNNYNPSEAVGRRFSVAPRSISLNSSMIGGTYDENKGSQSMISSFAFGVTYYFNVSNDTYGDKNVYTQMISVMIDGVKVEFDYNSKNTNKDFYELLPKNGGVYTFTLTVCSKEDGHAYGAVSTNITIVKAGIVISEDRAVIAKLNETKKMGELNLIESLKGKILNTRADANYTYLQLITPSRLYKVVEVEGVANATKLVEITIGDTLKSDWEIYFTNRNSETPLEVVNQAGDYTVHIKLANLGGYNDSNKVVFDFTIGPDDIDVDGPDFNDASIGVSTSKSLYATESVTEIDFGTEYYVNLNSSKYSTGFKQIVTILDANEKVYASYNYDTTTKGTGITWAQMPKAIGTYTINYEIQDKVTSETYITLATEYEIVKATSELIISNELLSILASQVVVSTDLNNPQNNKELIDDMFADVATAIGYNTRSNVNAITFAPALQVYNPQANSLSPLLLTNTSSANWTIAFTNATATDASNPLTSIKVGGDYKVWIGLVGVAGYEDIAPVCGEFSISTRNIEDGFETEDVESTIVQVKPNNNGSFPTDVNGNDLKEIDKGTADAEIFVKDTNGNETPGVYDEDGKLVLPQVDTPYVWEVSKDTNGNIIVTASHVIAIYEDLNEPEFLGNVIIAAGKDLIIINLNASEQKIRENTITNSTHTVERLYNENTVEYRWEIFQNTDGTATVSAMKVEGTVDEDGNPVTKPVITTAPGKETVYIDLGFDPMDSLDRDSEGNLIIPALTNGYTDYETDRTQDGYTVIRPFKNVTVYDYEGIELNVIKITTRVQAHLYDITGAYVSVLNPSVNNTITLAVLPEGASAWKFDNDNNGNHTITPIEDATKTFGPDSLGISIYTTKYSPKSVDSVGFGQVYYLNINSTFFADTTKYSQEVTYQDITGTTRRFEYDTIDKTETGLWLDLPKVAGEYTISLTVKDKVDGHNYGTITKTYEIVETKTNIEIHEDLVYEIQKNKILEENVGVTNVFPEVNAIIETGLTDANRLITVHSDTGSFNTFNGTEFVSYNFNYDDLSYEIVDANGNNVNGVINQWGDYKIIFTYAGVVDHYEGFVYEVDFIISDRAYYTTAQIGITLDGSSRVENSVGFSEQHFVYLNNREITAETHLVTYTVTNTADFRLDVNYWQYDLNNAAHKAALWNLMPKQIGTYTITVKVIELVDGEQVIVQKEMINTYTITPNRSVAIVCDATNQQAIRDSLNTISAAGGEELVGMFDDLLLDLVNVNYTLSTQLFAPTANITTITELNVKVKSLWTFTYYDENNNRVDSITTEGTYQLKITFNGNDEYNSATTSFIVFTIGNRPALIRNDIFIKYEGRTEALESFEYAEAVNSRFFVSIDRTGTGNQFQSPRYEIDVKITLKDSTRTIVAYEYFSANLSTVWAQMPKAAGVYTMHVTLKDSEDPIPFNTLTKDFTITPNEFDINAVRGNLANDVNSTLSRIGTDGTANNQRLTEALNNLLVANYFQETIFAAGTGYTVGTYRLDYTFFKEDGTTPATEIVEQGTYFVVIELTADNYTCEPSSKLQFNVKETTKFEADNAYFQYTNANDTYKAIPYFTGTEYGISLEGNDVIFDNTDISTFAITISIVNDATTEQFEISYDYKNETDVWSKMPKYVGKYNVTVTLVETMYGYEFPATTTVSVLEIKSNNEITINENTLAIEDKLSGFYDEAGEDILPKLKGQITVDLLTLDKEIYIAGKDGRTQVFTGTKVLEINDFEIEFFKDGTKVEEIREAGDYTVKITFKGVYGIYATSEYGFPIEVEVLERIVVSATDSVASFEVGTQFTAVSNVDLFNNGERYYFVVNDLKGATSILDMNTNKVVIILTSDKGLEYTFDYTYAEGGRDETTLNNLWAALPKVAGEYSVDVQVTYRDKLGDYVLVTRLQNTLNINPFSGMNLQDRGTNLEIEYNSKELATTLVGRFNTDTVVLTDANGNKVTQLFLLNSQNQLELVDITMDMFNFIFTDKDGNVVNHENLTEEGDYTVTVSLKEEYNNGYAGQMSYSQDFTVTPYEKAFDYRGFAIALILILAVIAVIVVRKMRR